MHSIRGTSFIPISRKEIECKTKVELGNRSREGEIFLIIKKSEIDRKRKDALRGPSPNIVYHY